MNSQVGSGPIGRGASPRRRGEILVDDEDLVIFETQEGEAVLAQREDGRVFRMDADGQWGTGALQRNDPLLMLNHAALGSFGGLIHVVPVMDVFVTPLKAADTLLVAVPGDTWTADAAKQLKDREVLFRLKGNRATGAEIRAITLLQTQSLSLSVERWCESARRRRGGWRPVPTLELQRMADEYVAFHFGGKEAAEAVRLGPVPRTALVQSLIPKGLVLLVGAPFAGKSTVTASLAASVAAGQPWLGRVVDGGPVLVLAGERIEQLRDRCALAYASLPDVRGVGPVLLPKALTLHGDAATANFDRLRQWLDQMPQTRLLVLDTLASLTSGLSESESSGMTTFLGHIKRLTNTYPDLTVLLIHHPTKSGLAVRGHGSLEGAADAVLDLSEKNGTRTLTLTHSNSFLPGLKHHFKLADSDGVSLAVPVQVTGCQQDNGAGSRLEASAHLLLQTLREATAPMSVAELQEKSGVGRTSLYKLLKELPEIVRTQGKLARYELHEDHP